MDFLTLKKANCKNCYKCIRTCPVKSIKFSENQAHIVYNECILCGQCFVSCPQGAKQIDGEIETVEALIASGIPVIVSLAPSFIANYDGVGIDSMRDALKKLGFFDVEETALGATVVKTEYERQLKEGNKDILISSCCHSINVLIRTYFPNELKYLANVKSPMQVHGTDIKRRYPNAKTVFIGPCIAKKNEAYAYGDSIDAVLTFQELTEMFVKSDITLEKKLEVTEKSLARFFPTTGGILKTMNLEESDYTYIAVDGVLNCIEALREISEGKLSKCFIEMSACVGSCINGPVIDKNSRASICDFIAVSKYAGKEDFEVEMPSDQELSTNHPPIWLKSQMPGESKIAAALKQMGKFKPEDELNCGSCGYNTCREKAIAVIHGKAELTMCLPFLKVRAENFSDTIIANTPNGIFVLNEKLEIQQINRAALNIMNIKSSAEVKGAHVVQVLDPSIFISVQNSGKNAYDQRVYLPESKKYVEQTVLLDKDYRVLICIMRDVTEEESSRESREQVRRKTAETADKVVEKQMRVVQEIASLLGETVAETKIALTKLKESIGDE